MTNEHLLWREKNRGGRGPNPDRYMHQMQQTITAFQSSVASLTAGATDAVPPAIQAPDHPPANATYYYGFPNHRLLH